MEKMKTTILLLLLLNGCAYTVQKVSTQGTTTNGVVEVRTIKSTAVAWGDARQTIEKLKVSNGKTQSIGLDGTESNATSTNIAANLQALTGLLNALRPTP